MLNHTSLGEWSKSRDGKDKKCLLNSQYLNTRLIATCYNSYPLISKQILFLTRVRDKGNVHEKYNVVYLTKQENAFN